MTYPTDQWPTQPIVWRTELPRCVGACQQGRIPCPHPLACSCTTLSAEEFDDASAELTTDRMPLRQPGELPDITGRLTDDIEALDQGETSLLILLLVVACTAWLAVAAHLIAIWRTLP